VVTPNPGDVRGLGFEERELEGNVVGDLRRVAIVVPAICDKDCVRMLLKDRKHLRGQTVNDLDVLHFDLAAARRVGTALPKSLASPAARRA